jgi:transcriptional adapter 3
VPWYHGFALGLILVQLDPTQYEPVDDPISTALRQAQHLLRPLVSANKARKRRLLGIARDRLGYQEYLDLRESIDRNITSIYTKLWNKDQPHTDEKKDKKKKSNAAKAGPMVPKHPAAHGLAVDDELNLIVPRAISELVTVRRQWVDKVGPVFEQIQEEHPGRVYGLPQRSIYEGIADEVREEVARAPKWKPTLRPKPEPGPDVDLDPSAGASDVVDGRELEDWFGADLDADADMEPV